MLNERGGRAYDFELSRSTFYMQARHWKMPSLALTIAGVVAPRGWRIFIGPGIHFVRDLEIAVPDLAGWRRSMLSSFPGGYGGTW